MTMDKQTTFRTALVYRIVAGLGAASAVATAACGDGQSSTAGTGGATGAGGAGGATTSSATAASTTAATTTTGVTSTSDASSSAGSSSSTGSGMTNVERCFPLAPNPSCPALEMAKEFVGNCTSTHEAVKMWLSGPTAVGTDCCYQVDVTDPDAPNCVMIPGRPFVVGGQARVAPVSAGRRGWEARSTTLPRARAASASTSRSPHVADLDLVTRAHLGRAWATEAAYEHASVASFGKLALELLSFGAPADLVRAAHEAALDEIGHAEMGFALASAYLRDPVGPGPLAEAREFAGAATLADLAAAAVREGCFGETLAAVVASAQLAAATDPAVREVLAIVAEEESRHAELSFRVVAWAVSRGDDDVRSAVHHAFLESLEEARHAAAEARSGAPSPAPVRAHGRLSTAEVLTERLRAAEEVVVPAMEHLLGAPV
jgi:hypothetical protein